MKILNCFLFFALLCWQFEAMAQYDAPAVEWKVHDIPPTFPPVPLGVPIGNYQPGDPLSYDISGEDWWYSVNPAIVSGQEIGYFATGYATWLDFDFDETFGNQGPGCKYYAANAGPDLQAPTLAGEHLSAKLATAALYDKAGTMVWCKAYIVAREGAVSSTVDSQGNIIITGKTAATTDVHGNTVLMNPRGTFAGDDLNTNGMCAYNNNKVFAAKISPSGDLLWMHLYSPYDMGTLEFTNKQVAETSGEGLDVVVAANGNYVVGARQLNVGNTKVGLFTVELDPNDGKIVNRATYFVDNHSLELRAISRSGTDFLVAGFADDKQEVFFTLDNGSDDGIIGRGHGFVLKLNSNLMSYTGGGFGNQVRNATARINSTMQNVAMDFVWMQNNYNETTVSPDAGRQTIAFDVKQLSNGNFAAAVVENCFGCRSSGSNRGVADLRIFNSAGIAQSQTPLNQGGDGYVTAFDLKIGFEPNDPSEITLITSVNEGNIKGDPAYEAVMAQSANIISNGTEPNLEAYYKHNVYVPAGGGAEYYDVTRTSALVGHYDINGNLEWEKIIDGDDAPIQVYPGDWKEQECLYQIMKGEDGEFVYVGNTSHNKDDYQIVKLYGNCHLDKTYAVAPADPVANNVVTLPAGTTIWEPATFGNATDINVRGEIHIPSGATLQIKGGLTVHFADSEQMVYGTKLVVEQGAQLIVHNATLTSADCAGAMWSGIEVWGDLNQPQYAQYQGKVSLSNQATIEHAVAGIRVWKPEDWGTTGGIVQAVNAHFRNNNLDVQFLPYTSNLGGAFFPNSSYFNNCTFITDTDYKRENIQPHVTLYWVEGVDFFGCDFADSRNVGIEKKNRGIFSIDAKYKVLGRFTGTTPTLHEYYDATDYDICSFTNLTSGVEALNVNTENSVTVDHSSFVDCAYGVRLSQVNDALVTRNYFDRTAAGNWFGYQYDIYLNRSSAFQIEGNELTSQPLTSPTIGILIQDAGTENNEVYKNKLNNLQYGCLGLGGNRNFAPPWGAGYKGLEFLCNEHTSNRFIDQIFAGEAAADGGKKIQGLPGNPAGNVFSSTGSNVAYHFYNGTQSYTEYWFQQGIPLQEPTLPGGAIQAWGTASANTCPTNFETVFPGPGKPISVSDEAALVVSFDALHLEQQTASAALASKLEQGDRAQLHTEVARMRVANREQVRDLLQADAPYLSESLLRVLAEKPSAIFPMSWLRDLVIANIDVAKDPEFMAFLAEKAEPLPTSMLDQIRAQFGTVTDRGLAQSELVSLERDLNRTANLLLKNITQGDEGIDPVAFAAWVDKRGDLLVETQRADNYLARADMASCLATLVEIDRKIGQLMHEGLQTMLQDYRNFKAEMVGKVNAHGVLEGLDASTLAVARNYAENATGLAQVQAQNLLCFFMGECEAAPDPEIVLQLEKTQVENLRATPASGWDFELFPNPNAGQFTIALRQQEEASIVIMDLNARIVFRGEMKTASQDLDISHLQAGIYFIQLQQAGSLSETKKVVLY